MGSTENRNRSREGYHRCSSAELGRRLEDWIWEESWRGEDLLSTYLIQGLLILMPIFWLDSVLDFGFMVLNLKHLADTK